MPLLSLARILPPKLFGNADVAVDMMSLHTIVVAGDLAAETVIVLAFDVAEQGVAEGNGAVHVMNMDPVAVIASYVAAELVIDVNVAADVAPWTPSSVPVIVALSVSDSQKRILTDTSPVMLSTRTPSPSWPMMWLVVVDVRFAKRRGRRRRSSLHRWFRG